MQLYFVRHGKTEWNAEKRLQGQNGDSPLLPEAYEGLKRVKQYLSSVKFDKVISSPQPRALTTAKLLTEAAEVTTDARLAEWNFGDLEGVTIEEGIRRYPTEMYESRYQLERFDGSAFGAESVDSVLARFDSLAAEAIQLGAGATLLWVGHGASGTAGIRHLLGFDKSELRAVGGLANNTVTLLDYQVEKGWQSLEWNKII